jgi:hypothetical protein
MFLGYTPPNMGQARIMRSIGNEKHPVGNGMHLPSCFSDEFFMINQPAVVPVFFCPNVIKEEG